MNFRLLFGNVSAGILELALNFIDTSNLLEAAHIEQSAVTAVQVLLVSSKSKFFVTKARLILYALAAGLQPLGSILYDELQQFFNKKSKHRSE